MTAEDFEQLQRVARQLPAFPRIGVFSPWREYEGKLFPNAKAIPRWRWNLNEPMPWPRRFDLLVACNVFMFSPDPERWFRHVFATCKYFLMIDPIRRRRSHESELTDDVVRYGIGDERPRIEQSFDLSSLGDRLLGYRTYFGGANEADADPRHVIAVFRGDLADPILRIDGYPTRVRRMLDDLTPLHKVLEQVETRKFKYHLGIVPTLLSNAMADFLNELEYMIPAVNGYDHAYSGNAQILTRDDHPDNRRTDGAFNEFRGQSFQAIRAKLTEGRQILEDKLRRSVEAYIPPCNIADRKTGRALQAAGYRYYLSAKRIPGCSLPWYQSDFHGHSSTYRTTHDPDVVSLDISSEWDEQRHGHSLRVVLDHLSERKAGERARGNRVGGVVTGSGATG